MNKLLVVVIGVLTMTTNSHLDANGEYMIGQVWSYDAREGEENSVIVIAKVEKFTSSDKVYHVYVERIQIKNPYHKDGIQHTLPHLPVSVKTLDSSVKKLVEVREEMRDISDGYNEWKKTKGGIFDIPMREVIDGIQEIINNQINNEK